MCSLRGITYRGMNGGGYTDMLSGRVQVAFDNLPRLDRLYP